MTETREEALRRFHKALDEWRSEWAMETNAPGPAECFADGWTARDPEVARLRARIAELERRIDRQEYGWDT